MARGSVLLALTLAALAGAVPVADPQAPILCPMLVIAPEDLRSPAEALARDVPHGRSAIAAPKDARTLVSPRRSHASLAEGHPVIYAGTARFDAGTLDWWSNYSGSYQPIAAFRHQAQLPEDRFVPWQRLQMGGIAMQRGMLTDRRPAGGLKTSAPVGDAKAAVAAKKADRSAEPAKASAAPVVT